MVNASDNAFLVCLPESKYLTNLSSLFRSHLIMVDQASNGFQAISMLENKEYNLILLGEKLDEMNGEEVLTLMRTMKKKEELPIIILARKQNKDDELRYHELGANDVFVLSKDGNELVKKIKLFMQAFSKKK